MEAEAQAVAASLQRSREQIRAELLDRQEDGEDRLAGLVPRSAVMSFLLAPERRGLALAALGTVLAFSRRSREGAGWMGVARLLWPLVGLAFRRR